MVDSAVLLGANRSIAQEDMRQVVDFEILLAKASDKETARNATVVDITKIMELPKFPRGKSCEDSREEPPTWQAYFNSLLRAAEINDITINPKDTVIQMNPQYFEKLIPLLNETNPR